MPSREQILNDATLHARAGRWAAAKDILLLAANRDGFGSDLEVVGLLAEVLVMGGEAPAARHYLRIASHLAPEHAGVARVAYKLAILEKDASGAEAAAERVAALAPRDANAWLDLAWIYRQHAKFGAAMDAARRGLRAAPDHPELRRRVALNMLSLGRAEEAAREFEGLARAFPDDAMIATSYASALNAVEGVAPGAVLSAHTRAAALITRGLPPRAMRPVTGRPVRLGVVSPDLHRHSVAFFVEAILRHHAATGFEVFAYDTLGMRDAVNARLESLLPAGRFRRITEKMPAGHSGPTALTRALAADAIDVAVELSGLTRDHRLRDLTASDVPLLATYLGYPNTTGCAGVDVRLVDEATDPIGSEGHAAERLVRLPGCFLCYYPDDPPPIAAPNSGESGGRPPTFCSFNAVKKLGDASLRLFAAVLRASPEARLLMKARGLDEASTAADVRARLAALGVEASRVETRGFVAGDGDHLNAYADADVALDTFPYHGTTTTCEALLMGVPVVTLAGHTHASRVGVSLLRAIGRDVWCAGDEREYVEIATRVMRERRSADSLGERTRLREALLGSALCDGERFARAFGDALRGAWSQKFE